MTSDDLDPAIGDALRSVPSPIDSTRNEHIAEALQHVHGVRHSYSRVVIGAVAAIVLVVGAFVIGRTSASTPTSPIVSAPDQTLPKASLSSCAEQFDSDAELVHTYEVNDVEFAVVKASGQTFILETGSCTYITQFTSPPD